MAGTKLCRKCKMEIPKGASKCPHCRSSQSSPGITLLAIIIVIGAVYLFFGKNVSSQSSGSVYTEDGQFSRRSYAGVYLCEATGYVVNSSGRDLTQVTVTVGFYNEAGQRVSTSGDVKYGLKNGERWFFTVTETGDEIVSAQIQDLEYL